MGGNSLLVTKVKANGAVEAWNTDNPDQIVEPWDRIVAVNGKSGKVAELQKLIKAANKSANIVLTVVRMPSEVASKEAPEGHRRWLQRRQQRLEISATFILSSTSSS